MGSSWFPAWLGGIFAVAFAVMLVAHGVHAVGARGWSRGWHGAHVLMAAGMLDMTWPGARMPVPAAVAEVVFWVAGLGGLAVAAMFWSRRQGVPWAWLFVTVDLGAMAYMFALPSGGHHAVTLVLAGWLVVESVAWTGGLLHVPGPGVAVEPAVPVSVTRARPARRLLLAGPRGVTSWSTRARLSAMGLGMAYMLLAMQFGMSGAGAGSPGDPSDGGAGTSHHHEASAVLGR